MTTLGDMIGIDMEDDFDLFDLTEGKQILKDLETIEAIDVAHVEMLQQKALRGAEIMSDYLCKLVKTTSYLDAKASSLKNKASLDYEGDGEKKVTMDMKKWAGESDPFVTEALTKNARAKGAKSFLENKLNSCIRWYYHYKGIHEGMKRTIVGIPLTSGKVADWETA